MKFSRRIIYFSIGVFLGVVLVIILFAQKDIFGFMPTNRVLNDIQTSNMMITPVEKEKLACQGIDEAFIFEMVENAAVNFSNSQTAFSNETFVLNGLKKTMEVKKYELEYKDKLLSFWIAPKDSISILNTITTNKCATKTTDSKTLELLYMPESLIFSKLNEKELWLNKNVTCQLECLNISEGDIKEVFKSGTILIKESFPNRRPNPVYFIKKTIKNVDWIFWVELGDTKTRIKYIIDATGIEVAPNQYLINQLFDKMQEEDPCKCYE